MKREPCIKCGVDLEVSDDVVECPNCESVMKVLFWDPLKLQLLTEDGRAEEASIQELGKEKTERKATTNIGFGQRLVAVLLDMLLFGVPMNLITALIFGAGAYDVRSPVYTTAFMFSAFCGLAYNVGMWAFADGATIGKKMLKIKIVKNDGTPLTFGAALGRYMASFISAIPCGLGYFAVFFDAENRGWHDRLANTKVVPVDSQ